MMTSFKTSLLTQGLCCRVEIFGLAHLVLEHIETRATFMRHELAKCQVVLEAEQELTTLCFLLCVTSESTPRWLGNYAIC